MRHVVGIGEVKVAATPGDVLITHALGSCLGVAIHDPVAGVGGLLHAMLPSSQVAPSRARDNPCLFIDVGVPHLFHECYRAGADKHRLIIKAAGGANLSFNNLDMEDLFQIGAKNVAMLKQVLSSNGVKLATWEFGGRQSRTLQLEVGSGNVSLGQGKCLRSL